MAEKDFLRELAEELDSANADALERLWTKRDQSRWRG